MNSHNINKKSGRNTALFVYGKEEKI